MMSGLKLAAIYGIMPNRLGFCGPKKKQEQSLVYDFICGKKKPSEKKMVEILKQFTGARAYYKLIAESNGIKDIFDYDVVRAYWIGNKLLDNIKVNDFQKIMINDLLEPSDIELVKNKIIEKAKNFPLNSVPHHSFNVYEMRLVAGLLIADRKWTHLLDKCRISWGLVKEICDGKIQVSYKPITYEFRGRFKIQKLLSEKEIDWDKNILPDLKIGDLVSIHWDMAIEIINQKDMDNLDKYTNITLNNLGY